MLILHQSVSMEIVFVGSVIPIYVVLLGNLIIWIVVGERAISQVYLGLKNENDT